MYNADAQEIITWHKTRQNLINLSKIIQTGWVSSMVENIFLSQSPFWTATSSAHHRKGCLLLPTSHILPFLLLEARFHFGGGGGRFGETLAGMAECRELPYLLIYGCCPEERQDEQFPPSLFICPPGSKQNCSDTLGHVLSKSLRQKKKQSIKWLSLFRWPWDAGLFQPKQNPTTVKPL